MSPALEPARPDWSSARLVAFDVDGTLYRQGPLRAGMLADLAAFTARTGDVAPARVIFVYRRLREAAGEAETEDFEISVRAEVAAATKRSPQAVDAILKEWLEERPLRRLQAAAVPGVHRLFEALRRQGKTIGVLSDYPAARKLAALGLQADHVVFAGDAAVGRLKPHPAGLRRLLDLAGADPETSVFIGDRADRDGLAARRAGVPVYLRRRRPLAGWRTFARFDDPLFEGLDLRAAS